MVLQSALVGPWAGGGFAQPCWQSWSYGPIIIHSWRCSARGLASITLQKDFIIVNQEVLEYNVKELHVPSKVSLISLFELQKGYNMFSKKPWHKFQYIPNIISSFTMKEGPLTEYPLRMLVTIKKKLIKVSKYWKTVGSLFIFQRSNTTDSDKLLQLQCLKHYMQCVHFKKKKK